MFEQAMKIQVPVLWVLTPCRISRSWRTMLPPSSPWKWSKHCPTLHGDKTQKTATWILEQDVKDSDWFLISLLRRRMRCCQCTANVVLITYGIGVMQAKLDAGDCLCVSNDF